MIFAAVLGIAITSYISLAKSNLNIASRAFYNNAGINLAETGLEEAMWSINQMVAENADAWKDWTEDGADAYRKWEGYEFDQNAKGTVRVYVTNYKGVSAPTLVARASVDVVNGADIDKWIVVKLSKRSKFANGLVAKESILFKGNNATVNSWNSDPNGDGSVIVPYSDSVKKDNGSVGSISVAVNAVEVQNADIWGYAATGGALPSVGPNGLVGSFATGAKGKMDMDRVSTDFSANFDPVSPPTTPYYNPLGTLTDSIDLPQPGDTKTDGKYYYEAVKMTGSNKVLTIVSDDVIIKFTDPDTSLNLGGGSGAINIASNASLQIYAPGSVAVTGQGVLNGGTTLGAANQPANFIIWGTSSDTQTIDIKGQGVLSAVVYAPNGDVFIGGNGDVMGSVVANDITVVGDANFHYDESLGNFDTGNPYGITNWIELTSADERAAWIDKLKF